MANLIKLKQLDQSELSSFIAQVVSGLGLSGGGGSGAVSVYSGTETNPTTVSPVIPTNPTVPSLYYSTTDYSFWIYKLGTGWVALIL